MWLSAVGRLLAECYVSVVGYGWQAEVCCHVEKGGIQETKKRLPEWSSSLLVERLNRLGSLYSERRWPPTAYKSSMSSSEDWRASSAAARAAWIAAYSSAL